MDERRRSYHNRIARVRDETVALVHDAAAATENATAALLDPDAPVRHVVVATADQGAALVAKVENEIVEMLALQAPVARDLRVILAALRIADIAQLCFGLARTLAVRAGQASLVLTPSLRDAVRRIGAETAVLLERADGAWTVLDPELAGDVVDAAERSRERQRAFLAELISLPVAPIEAAVDLGMVARAYERLTDHAVEIAERVVFAVAGSLTG